MTEDQKKALREDFEQWSGGFPPFHRDHITVYIDYGIAVDVDKTQAQIWLNDQIDEWK